MKIPGLAALASVATPVSTVGAIPKITRTGRYLYADDGTRFFVKGITYRTQGAFSCGKSGEEKRRKLTKRNLNILVIPSLDNLLNQPSTYVCVPCPPNIPIPIIHLLSSPILPAIPFPHPSCAFLSSWGVDVELSATYGNGAPRCVFLCTHAAVAVLVLYLSPAREVMVMAGMPCLSACACLFLLLRIYCAFASGLVGTACLGTGSIIHSHLS
ncbi:hypothetical protein B0H13DRAFT_1712477, partial [Mycena leptocephala]